MRLRAWFASAAAAALVAACSTVDPPASYTRKEGGADEPQRDAGAYERCRLLDRRFVVDADARVYGDPPGPQAVCVTLATSIPAGGPGAIVFCVAGALDAVAVPSVHELGPDLSRCAYCTDVETNCSTSDAGGITTCTNAYAVVTGSVRIVHLGRAPGEPVWIDLGDLEVARVTHRDETRTDVERLDCLFADGLTLQGVLRRGSTEDCAGLDATACAIANTAASRSP